MTAIKCYAVTSGACWLAVEGAGEPVLLQAGRLLPLATRLAVPSRKRSGPAARGLAAPLSSAPATAKLVKLNDSVGVTLLGGHFQSAGPQAEILLGMLPPLVHLQSETDRETLRWAFDRMRQELTDLKPGGFLIAQQLACMIFVQVLRLHFDESEGVGWLFALSDTYVGAAIAAMHRQPARRWTVAALALEVGMSRSGFAARFGELVGQTTHRISHALADAARRTQPVARRSRGCGRPLARVRIGKRVQHCLQARDGQHASSSRAPGGCCDRRLVRVDGLRATDHRFAIVDEQLTRAFGISGERVRSLSTAEQLQLV